MTTDNLDLPYPASSSPDNVPADLQALAEAVDAWVDPPALYVPWAITNIDSFAGTFEYKQFGPNWLWVRATFTAGTVHTGGWCKFGLPGTLAAVAPQPVAAFCNAGSGQFPVFAYIATADERKITFGKNSTGGMFTGGDSVVDYTFAALLRTH